MLLSTRTKSYTPEIRLKDYRTLGFNCGVAEEYAPEKNTRKKKCKCFNHFIRVWRADYRCIECMRDLSLELVLLYEIGEILRPTHETYTFDSFEKNKQFWIGDDIHLADNHYKVMKIDGTRVICAKLIAYHK